MPAAWVCAAYVSLSDAANECAQLIVKTVSVHHILIECAQLGCMPLGCAQPVCPPLSQSLSVRSLHTKPVSVPHIFIGFAQLGCWPLERAQPV